MQISYASASPSLTSGRSWPQFLRTVPSSVQVPSALASFITFFEWTQVLLVSEGLATTFQVHVQLKEIELNLMKGCTPGACTLIRKWCTPTERYERVAWLPTLLRLERDSYKDANSLAIESTDRANTK